jgi:uncharacterized protein (TIGR01777 family)
MRIVVTGATGSIGRRLVPALLQRGDRVAVVTRRPRDARKRFGGNVEIIVGDTAIPGPWQHAIDGADAVVHLAGAAIADGRWTKRRRDLIESSRIDGTHQVVNAIEDARVRPNVLVAASGAGYYGDTGDEEATERFPAGKGFLADLCVRWEAQAKRAEEFGVRVVLARLGVVLDEEGPALQRMLPWFRAALGATFGSGRQWMPWIWHGDAVEAILRCVDRPSLRGPVNLTAPEPCTQRAFAKALGRAIGRPVILRAPALGLRIALGGIADELMRSQRAVPKALLADGFSFAAPSIDVAMEALASDEAPAPAAPAAPRAAEPAAVSTLPRPSRPLARPRLLVVSHPSIAGEAWSAPLAGTREAVRAASGRGCAVVIASKFRGPSIGPFLVDPLLYPIAIVANGAVLWNHREGRAVQSERMEPTTLAGLVLAIRNAVPSAEIVFEGDEWLAAARDDLGEYGPDLAKVDLRLPVGELPPKPTVRLHAVGTPATVASVRLAVEPHWRERKVTLFAPSANRLTIASPLVDRAVAAQRIARKLGASREESMALVAEDDDLGLADWCGFSVATDGAPASVRRLAAATLEPVPGVEPLAQTVARFITE